MSDNLENLHARVEELHRRLAAADQVSSELRGELTDLLADLDRQWGRTSKATPLPAGDASALVDQISIASQRFEATHPVLAGTLERLADVLGQMGI